MSEAWTDTLWFAFFFAFFAVVVVLAIRRGQATAPFLKASRAQDPALYWFIVGFWALMAGVSAFALVTALLRR